jgi:hypothetical protein
MKSDISALKSDISALKKDMIDVKKDVAEMKKDVAIPATLNQLEDIKKDPRLRVLYKN